MKNYVEEKSKLKLHKRVVEKLCFLDFKVVETIWVILIKGLYSCSLIEYTVYESFFLKF